MSRKSVYDKIREAQMAGTFQGQMLAQGKDIKYYSPEYFETHTREEMVKEMNQDSYDYYRNKIIQVAQREAKQIEELQKKEISDRESFINEKREWAVSECMKKIKHLPQPIRPTEDRIRGDVNKIIGQPTMSYNEWIDRLNDYVGVVSTGEIPEIRIGDNTKPLDSKE